MRQLCLGLITLYQRWVSPLFPPACRFDPTCSRYACEAIRRHGMRNSLCMAIAPTATIANIAGVSASIEPNFSNLFVKSNLSGEFTFWTFFGLVANLLFASRFVIQWYVSERLKRSVIPVQFWYLSILGSVMMLIYAMVTTNVGGLYRYRYGFLMILVALSIAAALSGWQDWRARHSSTAISPLP